MVEQVTGRQQRVQFMLHATIIDLQQLVITLKTRFKSSDVHCLLLPMVDIPAA
jgi:glycerol-3-phosphate responsive antiterminator